MEITQSDLRMLKELYLGDMDRSSTKFGVLSPEESAVILRLLANHNAITSKELSDA